MQKKSLGQNFLRDPKILKKIADFARIEPDDVVVEVGPGEGGLTKILLERAKKVIAVEKDQKLAEELKERFKEGKKEKLKVICGDILELSDEFFSIFFEEKSAKREKNLLGSGSWDYKLVGNIPYYITGALFKKFLESKNQPKSITFVIQKEVAERILAKPRSSNAVAQSANGGFRAKNKKESILSISIKAYGTLEYGGIIKAGSFYPKPKVDSAIIAVRDISKNRFEEITPLIPLILREESEKRFFEILRAGFAHKRKLLIRNLDKLGENKKIKEIFEKCGIPEKARAENLSVEDWVCLTKELM